ncbi:MAG TPA: Ig-like domain-containing protein [Bacteroidetes bacterium]|nr:Ig-like domain-containing protein [Candidatus Limimorpha avicola]
MRKIYLLLLVVATLLYSCKKEPINTKMTCITPSELNLVLKERYIIKAQSEQPITYTSADELVATVDSNGIITCINVGKTTITVSNGYESIYINVNVSLFEEPLLTFGCSTTDVEIHHGLPRVNIGDSIYIYGGELPGYTYSVWQMDYFFHNDKYYLSDLYIKNYMDYMLDKFLLEKYYPYDTLTIVDTISTQDTVYIDEVTYYLLLDAAEVENASFIIGKHYNTNSYEDIRIFYQTLESDNKFVKK